MITGLHLLCLLTGLLVTPVQQKAAPVNSLSDCTQKRERCVESCGKQREACDRNTPNDERCVKQQNQCEAGCDNAWKKCEENSTSVSAWPQPRLAF